MKVTFEDFDEVERLKAENEKLKKKLEEMDRVLKQYENRNCAMASKYGGEDW